MTVIYPCSRAHASPPPRMFLQSRSTAKTRTTSRQRSFAPIPKKHITPGIRVAPSAHLQRARGLTQTLAAVVPALLVQCMIHLQKPDAPAPEAPAVGRQSHSPPSGLMTRCTRQHTGRAECKVNDSAWLTACFEWRKATRHRLQTRLLRHRLCTVHSALSYYACPSKHLRLRPRQTTPL